MKKIKSIFGPIGGSIYNEKDQEVYLLACIDRFSKFLSAGVLDRANGQNVPKYPQDYVL